jgi:hypothetical protein
MASMMDPSSAMHSFQEELSRGRLRLQRGALHPDLYVFADGANGKPRFTYVMLKKSTVAAFANFILCEPVDGTPCFQVGYAVPEPYRRQGRAKTIVSKAMAELQRGLSGAGGQAF